MKIQGALGNITIVGKPTVSSRQQDHLQDHLGALEANKTQSTEQMRKGRGDGRDHERRENPSYKRY